MTTPPALLVFSDLDGTLLDHESYDWRPAEPALLRLRRAGCGVILASSKTAAEMAPLREEIGFRDWPAIVENGGGVLPARANGAAATDETYAQIRQVLAQLPRGFLGFGDMSAANVSERTGLSQDAARQAKERQFSEPGLWTGDAAGEVAFLAAAKDAGLVAQRGGRFISLSFGGTKADRMAELTAQFQPRMTLALGDAPNDFGMLKAADQGVLVANPSSPAINLKDVGLAQVTHTRGAGPQGWNEAVNALLDKLNIG